MTLTLPISAPTTKKLANLAKLLEAIDPDISYGEWIKVMMVIFYETRGSIEGFELADAWSSGGSKYKGTKDVRAKWRYFKPDHPNPVRMGTLVRMANQAKSN